MNYTKALSCGCTIVVTDWVGRVDYCPKHKAAPDMYEALNKIAKCSGAFSLDRLKGMMEAEERIDYMAALANQALAKAEGNETEDTS